MIKLKDIAEKYGEYGINEDKLKEILIEPKPKTVWDLKENDEYYCLTAEGNIYSSVWDNYKVDYERLEMGNVFLTREDAEFERERLKIEAEMLKYGGTRDMMSLGDEYIEKYFIEYYHDPKSPSLRIDNHWSTHHGMIYFKSEEDAKIAIARIGEDRIKKYLFYAKE